MLKPTVLVVDDQPELRRLMDRMIRPAGFEVALAADRPTALELARIHAEDLVVAIVGAQLEGARGEEVLGDLHALLPGLPLVSMSGGLECGLGVSGVRAHLPKPFLKEELLRVVHALTSAGARPPGPDAPASSRSERS